MPSRKLAELKQIKIIIKLFGVYIKVLLTIIFLSSNFGVIAGEQFKKCDGTRAAEHHHNAIEIFSNVAMLIQSNKLNDHVKKGLRVYFKLSHDVAEDKELIEIVFENIKRVALNAKKTKYNCHTKRSGVWCIGNQLAIVPPPKTRVHLCPAFFNYLSRRQQIGTIIHEWFHRWGKRRINYLPENYCHQSSGLESKELIRNADQYMLFLYYVGTNGGYLECF